MDARIATLKQIIAQQQAEIFALKSVIDNVPVSVYWKNKAGAYQWFNKSGEESARKFNFNFDKKDVIGKTDFELFPKEMAEEFVKNDLLVINSGQTLISEETTLLPDGGKAIQFSTKKPLYDVQGNITGIIGSTVDITYLKEIEAALKAAKEQAEIADRLKTDFISNMEHDIRTPFSGIYGLAELMYRKEIVPEKKLHLGYIVSAAKELLDYCNEILNFSKITAGKVPIIAKKFALPELISQIVSMERPAAEQKNIIFEVKTSQLPSTVIGDSYRLRRILINLISNAIKFTTHGWVKINITDHKKGPNKLVLQCTVEDTGIGIPFDKQQLISEKFIRLSPSNKGFYKGLGLGMTVVKHFLNDLKGELDLTSEENQGTKFVCTIPFKLPLVGE